MTGLCAWWALCQNQATHERLHRLLGAIPICDRCEEKLARLEGKSATAVTGLDVEAARKVLLDSLPADTKWGAWVDGVAGRLTGCVTPQSIDLRDPETANAVADAIVRYHGGGYVPLSVRYPWQFQSRTWQAIDRDGVIAILTGLASETADVEGAADRILALVRTVDTAALYNHGYVDGAYKADENLRKRRVTLTPEEIPALQAALAVSLETEPWSEPIASTLRALVARLEAAS